MCEEGCVFGLVRRECSSYDLSEKFPEWWEGEKRTKGVVTPVVVVVMLVLIWPMD